jgi:cytoskeletal protein CcmA (bactofilin family)
MFKKDNVDEIETIIGPSVHVEGNFVANGDVVIEGTVAGSLHTEKNLRVGPNAKIFADVTAAGALIAGEVQGNIRVHGSLELTNTAKVFGDVKAQILSIGAGACLHGKCSAGTEQKSKLEKTEDVKLRSKDKPQSSAETLES